VNTAKAIESHLSLFSLLEVALHEAPGTSLQGDSLLFLNVCQENIMQQDDHLLRMLEYLASKSFDAASNFVSYFFL
jgi:hypothetical protein